MKNLCSLSDGVGSNDIGGLFAKWLHEYELSQ